MSDFLESAILLLSTIASLFIGSPTIDQSADLKAYEEPPRLATYNKNTDFSPETIQIIVLNNTVSSKVTENLSVKLSEQYKIPVHVARYQANIDAAFVKNRNQFDGKKLLKMLELPVNNKTYTIYVIEGDIYTEGYNYLFAHTDFKSHETVISVHRFVDETLDETIVVDRLNKLLMRRIDFAYGLASNKCVMYFANDLNEFDKMKATYCAEDKDFLEMRGILRSAQQ